MAVAVMGVGEMGMGVRQGHMLVLVLMANTGCHRLGMLMGVVHITSFSV